MTRPTDSPPARAATTARGNRDAGAMVTAVEGGCAIDDGKRATGLRCVASAITVALDGMPSPVPGAGSR